MGSTQEPIPQSDHAQAQDLVGLAVGESGQIGCKFKLNQAAASEVKAKIESLPGFISNDDFRGWSQFKKSHPHCQRFFKDQFPGCQPVSMDCDNIKLLENSYNPYMVSAKADGVRYMLFISEESKAYFIDRNYDVFLVDGLSFPSAQSKPLFNTLLDGELVSEEVGGNYLIYDALFINGRQVAADNFDVRYEAIEKRIICPREKDMKLGRIDRTQQPIRISRKKFFPIEESTITKLINDDINNLGPHKLDGLIFQPINEPYKPGTCLQILKWKCALKNSIDYELKITLEKHPRISGCQVGELMVGPGKYRDVYKPKHAFATIAVTQTMQKLDKKIIECSYASGEWQVMRERPDKKYPNGYRTAGAVRKSILVPVTESHLINLAGVLEKKKDAGRDPLPRKGVQETTETISTTTEVEEQAILLSESCAEVNEAVAEGQDKAEKTEEEAPIPISLVKKEVEEAPSFFESTSSEAQEEESVQKTEELIASLTLSKRN